MICNNCNETITDYNSLIDKAKQIHCFNCKMSAAITENQFHYININIENIFFSFSQLRSIYYPIDKIFEMKTCSFKLFPQIKDNIIHTKEYINKLNNLIILL